VISSERRVGLGLSTSSMDCNLKEHRLRYYFEHSLPSSGGITKKERDISGSLFCLRDPTAKKSVVPSGGLLNLELGSWNDPCE
jgi:hypothetical protein